MAEQIRRSQTLTEEEKQRLFGWGEDVFLLELDGEPVSHVGALRHEVRVGGKPGVVGGIGGVVTVPAAQGRGCAGRLLRHVAEVLQRDWKVDAGLLFCLPKRTAYYERLGWRTVNGPTFINQPGGRLVCPLEVMVLPFGAGWPSGDVELGSSPW